MVGAPRRLLFSPRKAAGGSNIISGRHAAIDVAASSPALALQLLQRLNAIGALCVPAVSDAHQSVTIVATGVILWCKRHYRWKTMHIAAVPHRLVTRGA